MSKNKQTITKHFPANILIIINLMLLFYLITLSYFTFYNHVFIDKLSMILLLSCLFLSLILYLIGFGLRFLIKRSYFSNENYFLTNKIPLLSSLVLLFFFVFLHTIPFINQAKAKNTKMIILGLDGASWSLIDPLTNQNELPNIKSMIDSGAHARLMSIEPMRSPSLWTSIATSRTFEDHGIDGFFSTSNNLKEKRMFDIAYEHGLSVGTYSWLLTRPVDDPFDFNIPGWMARTPETFPSEYDCVQEIRLEQGNHNSVFSPIKSIIDCAKQGATLSTVEDLLLFYFDDYLFTYSEEERFDHKMMIEVDLHYDIFAHLLKNQDPDLTTFILYGSDKLAHRFWHYMDQQNFGQNASNDNPLFANAITNYYKKADQVFGKIKQLLPEDCNILLISDHGMKEDTAMPQQFFVDVNHLLGQLEIDQDVHFIDIQREIILKPRRQDTEKMHQIQSLIENIYWTDKDEPVFRVRMNDDDSLSIKTNFTLSWYEDSPIITNDSLIINEQKYPTESFFELRTFSGTHHPEGVLIAQGPQFRQIGERQTASLYDIAPTALYLMNLPISQEMEGKILESIIDTSFLEQHEANYCPEYEPFTPNALNTLPMGSLYERLQSVGYTN